MSRTSITRRGPVQVAGAALGAGVAGISAAALAGPSPDPDAVLSTSLLGTPRRRAPQDADDGLDRSRGGRQHS